MKCFMCKGLLLDKLTTVMLDIDETIIAIRKVPSQVCRQCGEVTFEYAIAKQLEEISNKLKSKEEDIVIVNFNI